MKKLLLLAQIITTLITTISAQMNCEPCQWDSTKSTIDTICVQDFIDTHNDTVFELGVYVIVNWRKCDNNLIFDGAVVVDNRAWNNQFWEVDYGPTTSSAPWVEGNGCSSVSFPLSDSDLRSIYNSSVKKILTENSIGTTCDTYFSGACQSRVTIQYPEGSFVTSTPNDLGVIDTFKVTTLYTYLPCTTACCKVSWELRPIVIDESFTEYRWVPISYSGDNEACNAAPVPDYNSYPNKIRIFRINDQGLIDSSYGEPSNQQPCEIVCNNNNFPPPLDEILGLYSDKTSLQKIELLATPTLFKEYIRLISNRKIISVELFDGVGRRILTEKFPDTNELNTATLKSGVYYLQVNMGNSDIRSIKVLKQ